jgi:Tfp pilus assembly major pilin PilA
MQMNGETIAAVVAVLVAIGGVFYQAVAVKKDVETLAESTKASSTQLSSIRTTLTELEVKLAEANRDVLAQKNQLDQINQSQVEILKTVNGNAALVTVMLDKLLKNR